jgi:hypothetical protein
LETVKADPAAACGHCTGSDDLQIVLDIERKQT